MKSKITLSVNDPDKETLEWIANKIKQAHSAELSKALTKAQKAIADGKNAVIRTKPVVINVSTNRKGTK